MKLVRLAVVLVVLALGAGCATCWPRPLGGSEQRALFEALPPREQNAFNRCQRRMVAERCDWLGEARCLRRMQGAYVRSPRKVRFLLRNGCTREMID